MKDNPALYGAIMFHGAAVLPHLRAMPYDQLQRLGLAASELSQTRPLWMPLGPAEAKGLVIDEWEPGKQLTGPFVMALMIFSLFVQCGEDPEMCSSLYETWPIAEAVTLCPIHEKDIVEMVITREKIPRSQPSSEMVEIFDLGEERVSISKTP